MMPDELFCCDDSTRVASSPPSEVLKTLYDKDAKDLEGAAKQLLLPTNEIRHIRIVLTRIYHSLQFLLRTIIDLNLITFLITSRLRCGLPT